VLTEIVHVRKQAPTVEMPCVHLWVRIEGEDRIHPWIIGW